MKIWFRFVILFAIILIACNPALESSTGQISQPTDASKPIAINKPITTAVSEDALLQAQASGLIDDLIQQYWGDDIDTLHYDERLKIQLYTHDL